MGTPQIYAIKVTTKVHTADGGYATVDSKVEAYTTNNSDKNREALEEGLRVNEYNDKNRDSCYFQTLDFIKVLTID